MGQTLSQLATNGAPAKDFDDLTTWLRGEIEARGWSYADVAARLKVSERAVGRWARGGSRPYPGTLQRLRTLFKRQRKADAFLALAARKGIDLDALGQQLAPLPDKAAPPSE